LQAIGITPYGTSQSSPVITARTPGIERAARVSMPRMRACGSGLLRIAPMSAWRAGRSAVYSARPVTFSTPSISGCRTPTAGGTAVRSAVSSGAFTRRLRPRRPALPTAPPR